MFGVFKTSNSDIVQLQWFVCVCVCVCTRARTRVIVLGKRNS